MITKKYKNIEEIEKDIQNNIFKVDGNVCFECDVPEIGISIIKVSGDIIGDGDFSAGRIICGGSLKIKKGDLDATHIHVSGNIDVGGDINVGSIEAFNINARNINAVSIDAFGIAVINRLEVDKIYCSGSVNALLLHCGSIIARGSIICSDIVANNIIAERIKATNISYRDVCHASSSLECVTIHSTEENSNHPTGSNIKIVDTINDLWEK
ncbi:MAG: hypothetical protein KBG30_13995 [Bacteroidales bacterium]|nr:hypothetical protein [Bacteroidales bacterium]